MIVQQKNLEFGGIWSVSWGDPLTAWIQSLIYAQIRYVHPSYLIAKCGHQYVHEKLVPIHDTLWIIKYRVMGGVPDLCHECAEKTGYFEKLFDDMERYSVPYTENDAPPTLPIHVIVALEKIHQRILEEKNPP